MKQMIKLLTPLLALLLISTPLHADLEAGLEAYQRGDHSEAFKQYKAAAEAGDQNAFGKLAGMYLYGLGTEKDYSNAYIWFGLAEHTGDKYAERFRMAASSAMTLEQVKQAEAILSDYKARLAD